MADNMSYAVVVVTHDHATTVHACLAAVTRFEPAPTSIVVVDNASQDRSADVAAGFTGALPIDVVCQTTNTGFAAAVNTGVAAVDSEWVLSLNPDCAPRADFVAHLFAALAARPERDRIGSITGKLLRAAGRHLEQGNLLDTTGMVVTPAGRHFDRGAGEPDRGSFDHAAWIFGGTGAATLYRRAALDDVAYPTGEIFAESFFAYREDAELAWRLQWRGWRCLYEPTAVAAHARTFRPEEGRRGHESINRHSVRNRFLLRLHCADLWWHLSCLPWWLLRDLTVVAACLTVERSSLGALAEVWRLRHDAWQRRRWIMDRRSTSPRQVRRWFRRTGWVEEIAED